MVSEEQLLHVYERIVEDEKRTDACCRDIIFWEARTQIVRMNTVDIGSYGQLFGGGIVTSGFDQNISVGRMRRGLIYTIDFPIKWDNDLYVARNVSASSAGNASVLNQNNAVLNHNRKTVNYRLVENNSLGVVNVQNTNNNYSMFWYGAGQSLSDTSNNSSEGHLINSQSNWGAFVHDIKSDGTVTITDCRRNTNFDVIRFYTQWILRETGDGQMIPDPE